MVQLTLSNHNTHAPERQVTVDINTGICYFLNGQMRFSEWIKQADFVHPLLAEPVALTEEKVFNYEYDDIEGLFYSGIYVYARLLKVDKPQDYVFKIKPSARFSYSVHKNPIGFSLYRGKIAKDCITIKQLESITSRLLGFHYTFLDYLVINDEFSLEGLPDKVNGDLLYETNEELLEWLKKTYDLNRFELRYISPAMGLGVYSKQAIKKGDIISVYTGIKKQNRLPTLRFSFRPAEDCLNMYLDGSQFGNITRYINHAPAEDEEEVPNRALISANVTAQGDYLNGIGVIVYVANQDITQGEQLLVSYGPDYFKNAPMARFKKTGRILNEKKNGLLRTSQKKINQIKTMADCGVKEAQIHLLLRMMVIFLILIGLFYIG